MNNQDENNIFEKSSISSLGQIEGLSSDADFTNSSIGNLESVEKRLEDLIKQANEDTKDADFTDQKIAQIDVHFSDENDLSKENNRKI